MIELSFVIPAYNVEKFIGRCLNSIYSQSVDENRYEVIVVDDGSTDNTLNILKKLTERHKNLRVFSQENQGVSIARNRGLEMAVGKYVWFVDADDYIMPNAFVVLSVFASDNHLDVLFFGMNIETTDGLQKRCLIQEVPKRIQMSGISAVKQGYYPTSAWLALWRKSYLNKIDLSFEPGLKYGEDSLFSFSAVIQAEKVMFIDDVLYVYSIYSNSTTTTKFNSDKLLTSKLDDIKVICSLRDMSVRYSKLNPIISLMTRNQYQKILFGLLVSLYHNKQWRQYNVQREVISRLKEEQLYPVKGPFESWKKRVASIFLNMEFLIS
jgi:glycosyltransferase involved in cell wall biosynthesis